MATADSSNSTAFKTFSLENSILNVPPQDEIFRFDPEANQQILSAQPWKNECGILCDDSAGYRNNNDSSLVTITFLALSLIIGPLGPKDATNTSFSVMLENLHANN